MVTKNLNIFKPSQEIRNLRFLEELEKNPAVSQRALSRAFGIALGLTNACLRDMVGKGWIQIRGLSRRKNGYYVTPKGIVEKTRLTFQLVSRTVQQYSELKEIIAKRFLEIENKGKKRVVFYGMSDEMEIAYITLQEFSLKLVGIVEDDGTFYPQILLGYEIEPVSRIQELRPDCIFITSLEEIEQKREKLQALLAGKSIVIKDLCLP